MWKKNDAPIPQNKPAQPAVTPPAPATAAAAPALDGRLSRSPSARRS